MRFARFVFTIAGIWGIVVLTPLYWLVDITGRIYAPPADYPHFFYGFLSVAMAWQLAFLVIGSDPARFRPLMIPSIAASVRFHRPPSTRRRRTHARPQRDCRGIEPPEQ
jgi:cytochrome b